VFRRGPGKWVKTHYFGVVMKGGILVFAFEVFQKGVEHRLCTIFQEPPTAYESR